MGGYFTFMAKTIRKMIISKIVNNNFLTICIMLTFHKHSPFHRLGVKPVNIKVGITAGENTVKKSCLALQYTTKYVIFQVEMRNFNRCLHRFGVRKLFKNVLANFSRIFLRKVI